MTAIWALAAAVLFLAGAIVLAAWWQLGRQWPDTLDDDEIAERLAPVVASKLVRFAAEDADPPLEDWAQ